MIKQPSSVGFIGTFNEIITNYQKVFCREYNLSEKKHYIINPKMKGVRVNILNVLEYIHNMNLAHRKLGQNLEFIIVHLGRLKW